MTELEPVAYLVEWYDAGDRVRVQLDTKIEPWLRANEPVVSKLVTLSSAQSAIAERDARIEELEAALDEKEIASGLTDNGSLWRFWSSRAKDVATKLAAAEARAEAAEALMKEAGPIIETFAQIGDYVLAEAPADATMWYAGPSCTGEHMAQVSLDYFRAARAIHDKIGVKDDSRG